MKKWAVGINSLTAHFINKNLASRESGDQPTAQVIRDRANHQSALSSLLPSLGSPTWQSPLPGEVRWFCVLQISLPQSRLRSRKSGGASPENHVHADGTSVRWGKARWMQEPPPEPDSSLSVETCSRHSRACHWVCCGTASAGEGVKQGGEAVQVFNGGTVLIGD